MDELEKVRKVVEKKLGRSADETLLVLDATVGRNALEQEKMFGRTAYVSGVVMTKLDGTARGGVLVAAAERYGLPIHAIGVGEQMDDLMPFEPRAFVDALI